MRWLHNPPHSTMIPKESKYQVSHHWPTHMKRQPQPSNASNKHLKTCQHRMTKPPRESHQAANYWPKQNHDTLTKVQGPTTAPLCIMGLQQKRGRQTGLHKIHLPQWVDSSPRKLIHQSVIKTRQHRLQPYPQTKPWCRVPTHSYYS